MRISTSISWLLSGSVLASAQLLVAKNYATPHIVAGEPVEVTYEFYNQGEEYATRGRGALLTVLSSRSRRPVKNIELVDVSFLPPPVEKTIFKALPEDTYPMRLVELKGYRGDDH